MSSGGFVSVGGDVAQAGNTATGGAGEAGSSDIGSSGEGGTAGVGGRDESGGGGLSGGGGTGGHATYEIGPAAAAACMSVCSATQFNECAIGSLGPTCDDDCVSTFAIQSGVCTDLGVQMMTCLTETKPQKPYDECWIRFYDISQRCHAQVTAYQACVADAASVPIPPSLCARTSSYSPPSGPPTYAAGGCEEDRKCLNGLLYAVDCSDDGDGQSSCTCKLHGRDIRQFTWQGPSMSACQVNLADCYDLASSMFTP